LRSKYNIMICYLQFLYNNHSDLELEIIINLFQGKERSYHDFINGASALESVEAICKSVSKFLQLEGYPVSFIEYKESRLVN
jgi:hypothetical protein